MMLPPPQPPTQPTTGQVALGLFIVAQLVFLFSHNALDILRDNRTNLPDAVARLAPGWPAGKGHLWDATDQAQTNMRRWMQATGQDQGWSLFAPGVYKDNWFPALLISWGDDTPRTAVAQTWHLTLLSAPDGPHAAALWMVLQAHPASIQPGDAQRVAPALAGLAANHPLDLSSFFGPPHVEIVPRPVTSDLFLSDNEPTERDHYVRVGHYRLRRCESMVLPNLNSSPDDDPEVRKKRWRTQLETQFRNYGEGMNAYVRWRYAEYRRRHPEKPQATQVVLLERRFHIKPPDEASRGWDGPFEVPIARWRPNRRWDVRVLPLERYNPVTEGYESVWK